MNKGYGEPGSTMRSRLAGSRGPQRFILLALGLVLAVVGLNYWRLMNVNGDLAERVEHLEELLQLATAKSSKLNEERQKTNQELMTATSKLQKLQAELDEKVAKLKEQAGLLADMEEERTSLEKTVEENKEKHELELSQQLTALEARLAAAGDRESATAERLSEVRRQLAQCSNQTCDGRVTQLQFDLDTCRFSREHAGNPGIRRTGGGADPLGPGQLPRLRPGAVRVEQPALRGIHYHGSATMLFDPADAYRPPPRFSVAAAPAAPAAAKAGGRAATHSSLDRLFESGGMSSFQQPAAHPDKAQPSQAAGAVAGPTSAQPSPAVGAAAEPPPLPARADQEAEQRDAGTGDEPVVSPGQSGPAEGEVVPERPLDGAAPAASAPVPEVAPVDGDVVPEEAKADAAAADAEPGPAAAEAPAAADEEAPPEPAAEPAVEQAPVEDGAGLLSRPGRAEPEPEPQEGAAAGPADQLDPEYSNSQIKEELEKPDTSVDEEPAAAADPAPEKLDPAVREAALISGLQELSEKAGQPERPAAPPGAEAGADTKEAEPAAAGQQLADFEHLGAA